MKKVLFFTLILIFAHAIFAQTQPKNFDLTEYGVKIEPDKRLIAVMIALEAGGMDTPLSKNGKDFRPKLQQDLSAMDENLRTRLMAFVSSYKSRHSKATPGELTAPFVSLAYALTPAPEFYAPPRATDLPDDLLEVLDFAPLVKEVYNKPFVQSNFPAYLQMYQTEGEKMQYSASEMVTSLLDYLHTRPELVYFERVETQIPDPNNPKKTVKGYRKVDKERHFYIVPNLLATAGTVNFRNIRDDYYAVVPPNTNLRNSEARRGYLQFILDPLILKNGKEIAQLKDGIKSLLDDRRKEGAQVSPDVFLAVLRSLVAAVDARELEFQRIQFATVKARQKIDQAKDAAAKKAVSDKLTADKQVFADETALELADAYQRGAVLAFYFAEQLKGIEDSGFDIAGSLRDMILAIDPAKEKDRLAQTAEARKRALTAREERKKQTAQLAVKNEAAYQRAKVLKVKLEEVDKVIAAKDFPESTNQLNKLLEEFPDEASSIYYSLGRVASLSAQGTFDETLRNSRLDTARTFYINAINSSNDDTDPALIQLTYVALGRIFEFYEENNIAYQIYQTATKYGDLKGGAYSDAVAGIKRLLEPKKPQEK
ncbi:MAG TPA: hypothetical protein PKY82_14680 [Pyrinomonadaceae bacterium]|nr:hypothetical protein [Pyrinomonadaceae bacterium]